jgi:TonB family protein
MKSYLQQGAVGALFLAAVVAISPIGSQAQGVPGGRKLVNHVAPAYPALARTLGLEGVVRVDALVEPDGSVKAIDVKGGHPVLAQAAANAVRRWRWEPSTHESHELIQVKFTPE